MPQPSWVLTRWQIEELRATPLPRAYRPYGARMARIRELAERYGVSVRTIERWLRRFGT